MKFLSSLFFISLITSLLMAQSTMPGMDSRSMGMGGAFVADSPLNPANLGFRGNMLFSQENSGEAEAEDRNGNDAGLMAALFFGTEYVVSGSLLRIADETNDISERNGGISAFQNTFTGTPTYSQLHDAMKLMNALSQIEKDRNGGAYVDIDGHLDLFFQNMGIYVNTWGHAGVQSLIDTNNLALSSFAQFNAVAGDIWGLSAPGRSLSPSQQDLAGQLVGVSTGAGNPLTPAQAQELVYQSVQAGVNVDDPYFQTFLRNMVLGIASNGNLIQNNDTGVRVRSFAMGELNFSFGQSVLDIASVGINLKVLQARLFDENLVLRNIHKVKDIFDDVQNGTYFDNRVRTYERFNMDLGATVRPPGLGLSVSLYAKNLVPYSLNYPGGGSIDIHTQFRAGVSYTLNNMLTFALDADLNRITYDSIKNYKAQTIAGGVEWAILPSPSPVELFLRVGAFKNVADDNQDAVLTTGLGVKVWKFAVNAGGGVSWFKKVTIRSGSNDIDVYERASFGVNAIFATDF